MKTSCVRCHCGQRIITKDVVQRSWYVRVFGPSFMYLKFRCSRCKRVSEKFIEQDKWDDSILRDIPAEVSLPEKKRLDGLGAITVDEEIEFHFALEEPDTLGALRKQVQQSMIQRNRRRDDASA
jgi:DNA-directed RNA polymerase subunit RPC12/RpoP